MSELSSSLPPLSFDLSNMAVFLDFDGTLVDIAERPDAVIVAPATKRAMDQLSTTLSGALAIVTGRNISDIDRFLEPLHLPVAGVHGLERRSHGGALSAYPVDAALLESVAERLAPFLAAEKGLLLERKREELEDVFRALYESTRTIALIPAIRADLARGESVVIQLVSTSEAMLNPLSP